MVVTPRPLPRHQELGLAGGAEQVRGQGLAVSQLVIAEDVRRLLGPGGLDLDMGDLLMLVTPRCAGMSPPPESGMIQYLFSLSTLNQ